MSNHAILLTAGWFLWFEVVSDVVRALGALSDEKAASLLVYAGFAAFDGYLAVSLWGLA